MDPKQDGCKELIDDTYKIESSCFTKSILPFCHCVYDFECPFTSSMEKLRLDPKKNVHFRIPLLLGQVRQTDYHISADGNAP